MYIKRHIITDLDSMHNIFHEKIEYKIELFLNHN